MPFHGDDVDLCWRAHLSGARVVVAPQARVRHREELDVRRPDLHHDLLRARHRMRSVATLTGGARLPVRSLELAVLTVVELVVGLFTGRFGEAWASLRAFVGLLPRTPALLARRGTIAKLRRVDDAEVLSLQSRGSARLTAYRRARDTETYVGAHETVRRWRESSIGTTVVWIAVAVGIIVASRTLIDTKVPAVGELLPLPDSPRAWWADFTSAWSAGGLGNAVANPTGWAALSVGSVLWLFRMGLGLTVLVVGAVFVGVWGAWRLATLFPSNRSRMAVIVVYAAIPLTPGVISTGRFTALVGYAAIPWFVHLLRLAVGLGTADPKASDDLVDGIIGLGRRERLRRTALVALVAAVAAALAPAVLAVAVLVTLVLALAGLAAGSGLRTAGVDGRPRPRRVRDGVGAQPAVVADVVVGRPGRTRAPGCARTRGRRRRLDGHRPGPLRDRRPGALRAGDRRPRPGQVVAADVGGARRRPGRRLPRPGGAPGS